MSFADGLELIRAAVDLWVREHGGESLYEQCQRADGFYEQWAWYGGQNSRQPQAYTTAENARKSGRKISSEVNAKGLTVGNRAYSKYGSQGHVMAFVGYDGGRVLVGNTANTGDTVFDLGNHWKVSHLDTVNLPFLQWNESDGTNPKINDVPNYPAALGPGQRKVRSDNEARRRQGAATTSAPQGNPLPPNMVGNFAGWVTGENVGGNNLWYVGTSGDYFHSGSFTEISTRDLKDMNTAIAGNQRQVLSTDAANQRAEAKTSSPVVSALPASSIATFDGWVTGDVVNGNGVWLRDVASRLFSWSGGFADTGVHDLANLNEYPPEMDSRAVGAKAANVRTGPYKAEMLLSTLAPGTSVALTQYATGDRVEGIDVWYVVPGGWAWAGGFTSQSISGLEKIATPPPSGGVVNTDYKSFTVDSPLAKWIGSPNFDWRDRRPAGAAPTHITMHWMDGTLAGTDAQFQKYTTVNGAGRTDGSSSNYGIGQADIHQYAKEGAYQQADGDTNSNRWGLSIEHEGSTTSPVSAAVVTLSVRLLVEIAQRWGWTEYVPFDQVFNGDAEAFRVLPDATQLGLITNFAASNPTKRLVFPHKAWASTSCPGTLDWKVIVATANAILAPMPPDPEPGEIALTRAFVEAQADLWKGMLD